MGPSQHLKIFLAARLGPLAVGSILASEFDPRLRLLHNFFLSSFFILSPTVMPLPWFAGVVNYSASSNDERAASVML
jgi:hypothetical protein